MYVYHKYTSAQYAKREYQIPYMGVTGGGQSLCGFRELNPCSLWEQQAFLTM